MKKRPTRKKLLEATGQIAEYSKFHPVRRFTIYFIDENGALLDEKIDLYTLDDLVAALMDKSIFYRIVRVSSSDFLLTKGIGVYFTLMPDREYKTNIDAEFLEKIMRLEVESYESRC